MSKSILFWAFASFFCFFIFVGAKNDAPLPPPVAETTSALDSFINPKCRPTDPIYDPRVWGLTTPVRNQAGCGSDWAIVPCDAYNINYLLRRGKQIQIAPQQLIDCDVSNNGCNGGWYTGALKYLSNKAPVLESQYPYRSSKSNCKEGTFSTSLPLIKKWGGQAKLISSTPSPADTVKHYIARYGSVMGAIYVTNAFSAYRSGVFSGPSMNGSINHGILIVGWNDEKKAWLCKNTFGTGWGEKGYIWMSYNANKYLQTYCYWLDVGPPS